MIKEFVFVLMTGVWLWSQVMILNLDGLQFQLNKICHFPLFQQYEVSWSFE